VSTRNWNNVRIYVINIRRQAVWLPSVGCKVVLQRNWIQVIYISNMMADTVFPGVQLGSYFLFLCGSWPVRIPGKEASILSETFQSFLSLFRLMMTLYVEEVRDSLRRLTHFAAKSLFNCHSYM
jgi:hypothetical protein